jgi:hypothetical protein
MRKRYKEIDGDKIAGRQKKTRKENASKEK